MLLFDRTNQLFDWIDQTRKVLRFDFAILVKDKRVGTLREDRHRGRGGPDCHPDAVLYENVLELERRNPTGRMQSKDAFKSRADFLMALETLFVPVHDVPHDGILGVIRNHAVHVAVSKMIQIMLANCIRQGCIIRIDLTLLLADSVAKLNGNQA